MTSLRGKTGCGAVRRSSMFGTLAVVSEVLRVLALDQPAMGESAVHIGELERAAAAESA